MANEQKKLNRQYRLVIQKQGKDGKPIGEAIVITNPITVRFDIDRSIYAGIASMNIDIFNLAPTTRNQLFKDWFYDIPKENFLYIVLSAGYEGMELSNVFIGDIYSAYTTRQGTDVITRIVAKTGLRTMADSIEVTLKSGCTTQDVTDVCMNKLTGLSKGKQVVEKYIFTKPVALADKPLAILKQYNPNKNVFIDLNKVNILGENEGFKGWVPVITDSSGLLNAPERKSNTLIFKMIFEPRFELGQIVELSSNLAPQFNGQYKIFGIKHEGMISDSVAGKVITTVELNIGSVVYGGFKPL